MSFRDVMTDFPFEMCTIISTMYAWKCILKICCFVRKVVPTFSKLTDLMEFDRIWLNREALFGPNYLFSAAQHCIEATFQYAAIPQIRQISLHWGCTACDSGCHFPDVRELTGISHLRLGRCRELHLSIRRELEIDSKGDSEIQVLSWRHWQVLQWYPSLHPYH